LRLWGSDYLNRDLQVFGGDVVNCLEAERHDVGELDVTLPASGFPACRRSVSYVTQSIGGDGGQCSSTSSQLCLTNADCPSGETCTVTGGSYKLHYTIARRS